MDLNFSNLKKKRQFTPGLCVKLVRPDVFCYLFWWKRPVEIIFKYSLRPHQQHSFIWNPLKTGRFWWEFFGSSVHLTLKNHISFRIVTGGDYRTDVVEFGLLSPLSPYTTSQTSFAQGLVLRCPSSSNDSNSLVLMVCLSLGPCWDHQPTSCGPAPGLGGPRTTETEAIGRAIGRAPAVVGWW